MTVATENNRNDFVGDNSTPTYPYTFKIFQDSDLLVTEKDTNDIETTLVLTTDYTVSGAGNTNGGSITLVAGNLATDYELTIRRVLPIVQETDIRNQGTFFPEIHEDEFDKGRMIDQQQQDEIDRSVKLPETETGADVTLPSPEASKVIAWDDTGLALENLDPGSVALATPGDGTVTAAKIDDTDANEISAVIGSQEWIIIGSQVEADYATLAAYIADSPAAGDQVLITEDQTVTVQTVIPVSITLRFIDGASLLCATNIATSVVQFGNDTIVDGVLNVTLSQTGTTAKAVEINGDNLFGQIVVTNSSTGTLTDAFAINSGKGNNNVVGIARNTGGGTLTNVLTDSSAEASNNVVIVDEPNTQLIRSDGARTFNETVRWSKGADVASASALAIGSDGNYFDVTGTTTITSINTAGGDGNIAPTIKLHFDAALTLTHHATDLILPGGANITTAAGDEAEFIEYASGDWRCTNYVSADGAPIIAIEGARAWVNFNGTGTLAVNDSFNVTSVTDNSTGDYTVNFTTNFANANYTACFGLGFGGDPSGTENNVALFIETLTTSTARILAENDATDLKTDVNVVTINFMGNQ
jgi:hypothetical protein